MDTTLGVAVTVALHKGALAAARHLAAARQQGNTAAGMNIDGGFVPAAMRKPSEENWLSALIDCGYYGR